MHHPTTTHLEAAKRVLRFVKGTLLHGIHFSPGPLTFSAFIDADWVGNPSYRRSTAANVFTKPMAASHSCYSEANSWQN
uniref:Uncharacterized protein n=1 Tax=Quercus lobata TaxID=97700 RepID=A0A7N2L422_QUELO